MVTFAKSLPLILISTCWWYYLTSSTVAQIVPDATLGDENSIVTPNFRVKDTIADYLEGGAVRGQNLFHSFSEFNIPDGAKVYFASPGGIEQILTRVTGNNLSEIQGTLGVDGSANLFLLNPNGIIFGQNSQLDLAGSFLATTADSYLFQNELEFSTSNPQTPHLLAVNIPLGLQFGSTPGSIINYSGAGDVQSDVIGNSPGLWVGIGQTLSLLGGEIALEGGQLSSTEGRIELGAVGANNRVNLSAHPDSNYSNWLVDYGSVTKFADIKIRAGGGIDGGDTGKTQIALTGKNISFGYDFASLSELDLKPEDFFTLESLPSLDQLPADRVQVSAHNHNNDLPTRIEIFASDTFSIIDPGRSVENISAHTSGVGEAGTINLVADTIITYGASLESWTLDGATGNSGTINLIANNASIQHGGGGVNTFSQGKGGLINLDVAEDIVIGSGGFGAETRYTGTVPNEDVAAAGTVKIEAKNLKIVSGGIGTGTFGSGKGGLIDLKIARNLIIHSGGFGADAQGSGDGGSIEIEAQNIEFLAAGLGANTFSSGKGGEIRIDAETMVFQDGVIGAESGQNIDERDFVGEDIPEALGKRNAGNGGSIYINAQSLLIDNGNITTSTFGTGNAGDLTLQINSVEAIGGDLVTGINSTTKGSGTGGKITLNSDRLKLSNGATIAADSTNIGQAGNIEIQTQKLLHLENGGTISVNGGGRGLPGNIAIRGAELALKNGNISATTNRGKQGNIRLTGEQLFLEDRSQIITSAGKDATGGNIFIDLKYNLLGLDGSQITASAEKGTGGNIQISTKGIFLEAGSNINASSKFGIDGLIRVDTLAVDLDSDLIQLPNKPVDPSQHLARGCSYNKENKFISIGRGGLPPNPLNNIVQQAVLADLGSLPQVDYGTSSELMPSKIEQIFEAQAWKINQDGKIELVVDQGQILLQNQISCLKMSSETGAR